MSVILTIGRSPDNDIVIAENYISSRHAQLIMDDDGKWFINDLQSLNGTYVNGDKVTTAVELKEDDQVLLGGSLLAWKEIFQKYKKPDPPKKMYQSKLAHYIWGLIAALAIFFIIYSINEYYFSSPSGKSHTKGIDNDTTSVKSATNDHPGGKPAKKITYDLSCVTLSDNKDVNRIANKIDSLESNYVNNSGITVSLEEEVDFGNENHQQLLKGGTVLNNADSRHLQDILQTLASKIVEPRGFHYQFFLVDSKEINSWTSGGRIYFTTAMLNFTKNDDEIAGIIGHEINHNELYHINNILKQQKFAIQKFGNEAGAIVASVNKMITAPFGKKDEVYCDLKGEDLVIAAGYDPCNVVKLWTRMAQLESTSGAIDDFMRSHPYANTRITCIENHLLTNYNISCAK